MRRKLKDFGELFDAVLNAKSAVQRPKKKRIRLL